MIPTFSRTKPRASAKKFHFISRYLANISINISNHLQKDGGYSASEEEQNSAHNLSSSKNLEPELGSIFLHYD
jgi:hypothetical protein